MDTNLAAEAIEETAAHERMRWELTHWHAIRGCCAPMPDQHLAAWQVRLARLEGGAAILRILAEPRLAAAVRALDPRLAQLGTPELGNPGPLWP